MINMSLNSANLDAFYICAQLKHFTHAAERLYISQSALSQRIKNLEAQLKTTLFIRERSGLKLTEHGEELLRYCQVKDQLESQLIGKIKDISTSSLVGTIKIGGFSSIMRSVILPSLEPLLRENPRITLKIFTRELYELRSMFKSGEIDYMVLDQNLKSDNVISKKIGEEINVLAQKKNYKGPNIYLDHDEKDKTTIKYLNKHSTKSIERQYLDDIYGIIDGLRLGIGKAIVPKHLIHNDNNIEILVSKYSYNVDVFLHHYSQSYYSELQQAVVKTIQTNTKKYL